EDGEDGVRFRTEQDADGQGRSEDDEPQRRRRDSEAGPRQGWPSFLGAGGDLKRSGCIWRLNGSGSNSLSGSSSAAGFSIARGVAGEVLPSPVGWPADPNSDGPDGGAASWTGAGGSCVSRRAGLRVS